MYTALIGRAAGTGTMPAVRCQNVTWLVPLLAIDDAEVASEHLQILKPPVAGILAHLGQDLPCVRHAKMVSLVEPLVKRGAFAVIMAQPGRGGAWRRAIRLCLISRNSLPACKSTTARPDCRRRAGRSNWCSGRTPAICCPTSGAPPSSKRCARR